MNTITYVTYAQVEEYALNYYAGNARSVCAEIYSLHCGKDAHTYFFEVNYVMRGTCKMVFENETQELTTGQLCIIAPYSRHDVTISDDSIVISLMLHTHLKTEEAAALSGYQSVDHFSRLFKKIHNISPQKYRKETSL